MAHYELDEDQRARVQLALAKDEADLKKLKKDNAGEGLDTRYVDAALVLVRGAKGGKPGLIQIFSNQTEVFAESGSDGAQLSIEDALVDSGGNGKGSWADWVPTPRPVEGDEVLALDGSSLLVVTDALGFEREGGDHKTPPTKKEIAAGVKGIFGAFVVPIDLYKAHTPADKQKVHVTWATPDGGWAQVPSPEINVGEIREAVKAGIVDDADNFNPDTPADDQRTVTDLAEFGQSESGGSSPEFDRVAEGNGRALEAAGVTAPTLASETGDNKKPRGRKRAAAGNLAGAVKKEVARATGDRKINARKGGKK